MEQAEISSADRRPSDDRWKPGRNGKVLELPVSARHRSRLTNAKDILAHIDGRSAMARRYRDIVAQVIADQGGTEISEARCQLARRFAATACLAEAMEARLTNGETIDIAEYSLLVSTMTRVASRIGIDRRSRDVTPSLRDYLRESGTDNAEASE
jgi:hypothetical protein